ncbi:MAG: tetratricopeptide repeat protein [Candidatus Acidiferrales bacterium]
MLKGAGAWIIPLLGCVVIPCVLYAQTPSKSAPASTPGLVERAVNLAAEGHCSEALAILKKLNLSQAEKQVRYSSRMAIARCAMSLGEDQTAFDALMALRREFPKDPQVLYITAHFLSEMATRASQELAAVAPDSYQARELEAEAFESQEKWEDAGAIYKKILEENSKVPGVHYRLGRVALARPPSPENTEEAKREFEQELTSDPLNASAEFWLGEIARLQGQWEAAISRFTSAAKLDPGFAEAYLALGMTLNSARRFQESIEPLERYIKTVPADPAGHYQLSIAYARTGRKTDATREIGLQQQLAQKQQDRSGSPPGTAQPQ